MSDDEDLERVADALLLASRALVAIATRSLDDLDDDVTLPQYRALVVLATRGPLNLTQLASTVGVQPSNAYRVSNRLVQQGLVTRSPEGRAVTLHLTDRGRELIDAVLTRRRGEIARAAAGMTPAQRRATIDALTIFAAAAGESDTASWV